MAERRGRRSLNEKERGGGKKGGAETSIFLHLHAISAWGTRDKKERKPEKKAKLASAAVAWRSLQKGRRGRKKKRGVERGKERQGWLGAVPSVC